MRPSLAKRTCPKYTHKRWDRMTDSTDAAISGNPGNSGGSERLAPHGGCWWEGCKICNPQPKSTNANTSLPWRKRRVIRTDEHIAHLNRDKLIDDGNVGEDPTAYITRDWGNVQIAWKSVKPGDVVTIALKERVVIGSHRRRLIAQWNDHTVVSRETCEAQEIAHCFTICPECIEVWCWDHLIRDTSDMVEWAHGSARAYDYFGCRCDPCTIAHGKYLAGEYDRSGYKTEPMR